MKSPLLLAMFVALWAGCVANSASRQGANTNTERQSRPGAENANMAVAAGVADAPQTSEGRGGDVPPEWKDVDFKNFSYPVSWGRRVFKLDKGEFEFYQDKGFEDSNGWFNLKDVYYADLTGDRRKEAIVWVSQVVCGGSCDGGSDLFYFYTVGGRRPKLLWRLETGSNGYGCGLKSLAVKGGMVTVEVFKTCSLDGVSFVGGDKLEPGEPYQKFSAKSFTCLLFEFDGRRFALKKREVFPNPQENVKNYSSTVSISDE